MTDNIYALAGMVGTCTFPFVYEGHTYTTCADVEAFGGVGWCAFDGTYTDGRWGYCTEACRTTG